MKSLNCARISNSIWILSSFVLIGVLARPRINLAAEGTWTQKADMPTARFVPSSGVVDGKIYVMGGTPDGHICFPTVEQYDPATDAWTRKANMPMVRGAGASSVVNGRVYAIGGGPGLYGAPYSSVLEYDATTDTWTPKANMPTARCWLSSSVVDGKIYAIGGALTYKGRALSRVEEYDPATDTWTRKADMPTARTCLSTSTVNGKIYAIGGSPGYGQWYQGLSTVEEYDPATDTWTKKADMTTPRTYLSTCVVNGRIYAFGGLTMAAGDHLSSVEEYDPATDTWTRKADMPTARSGLTTCAVNGKMYAVGGWADSNWTAISTVEQYDPNPLVVDFNGDGRVDGKDVLILAEHWGQDDPTCDIAPPPFGDGVVDLEDLIVLAEHIGQEVTDPTLLAHWALDETEGMVALDSAGDSNGTVMGIPAWRPAGGAVGGALDFDGATLVVADSALNPGNGPFSVLAWVKGGAPGQVIMSQQGGANWLKVDASLGALATELKGGRGTAPLYCDAVLTDGAWHRAGFTWDGTNRRLYVDDLLVSEDTHDTLGGAFGRHMIGCGANMTPDTFWTGLIDDVRIYNRPIKP